jgi:hypothetical protein
MAAVLDVCPSNGKIAYGANVIVEDRLIANGWAKHAISPALEPVEQGLQSR